MTRRSSRRERSTAWATPAVIQCSSSKRSRARSSAKRTSCAWKTTTTAYPRPAAAEPSPCPAAGLSRPADIHPCPHPIRRAACAARTPCATTSEVIIMKCLVTGGAGFIGSHLTRALLNEGHDVWVLDDFSTGKRDNIESLPVELVEGDVRDALCVRLATEGMDYVFHLAARASVGRSLRDPLGTHSVNETGTLTVLDACLRAGVKRVVYAASSSAYGNLATLPKREDAKPAPASP